MHEQGHVYIISFTMRIAKFTLLAKLFVLHHLSAVAFFSSIALTGIGDGDGNVLCGDGVGMEKIMRMGWERGSFIHIRLLSVVKTQPNINL